MTRLLLTMRIRDQRPNWSCAMSFSINPLTGYEKIKIIFIVASVIQSRTKPDINLVRVRLNTYLVKTMFDFIGCHMPRKRCFRGYKT